MVQGTLYKSVAKNAAYIFFIKLFPALAAVVILVLYSRYLPPEAYGQYQRFWVGVLLFGTFAYAGLPAVIITYTPSVLHAAIRRLKKPLIFLLPLWILLWSLLFIGSQHPADVQPWVSGALVAMYAIYMIGEALLMTTRRMNGLLAVNILYGAWFIGVHFHYLRRFDLGALLFWIGVGSVLRVLIVIILINTRFRALPSDVIDDEHFGRAKRLWWHLGVYDLLQTLFRYLDKFILGALLSAKMFAVYFNGSQPAEVPFLPYLIGAVSGSVMIQAAAEKQSDQAFRMLNSTSKLLAGIVFPLFFLLFFYRSEIFDILLTAKYASSVNVFAIALLVLPLRAYNYTTQLQLLHRGDLIIKGALIDLVLALAFMYPLYQVLGVAGVAFSFVASTYLQVGYYVWHTTRLLQLPVARLLPLWSWLQVFSITGVTMFLTHQLSQKLLPPVAGVATGCLAAALLILIFALRKLRRRRFTSLE